jgi:hypothetical protein
MNCEVCCPEGQFRKGAMAPHSVLLATCLIAINGQHDSDSRQCWPEWESGKARQDSTAAFTLMAVITLTKPDPRTMDAHRHVYFVVRNFQND